jgi:signal transduction histidine kinase
MQLAIVAERAGDRLLLDVADDGRGDAANGSGGGGIGLRNVQERLVARFGDKGRLATEALPRGFRARLEIPLLYS